MKISLAPELLARCGPSEEFLASLMEYANYRRIWARDDSVIAHQPLQDEVVLRGVDHDC